MRACLVKATSKTEASGGGNHGSRRAGVAFGDPQFGARPLKRAIQEQILNPLSMRLLEDEFKPGDKIKVTARNDELVFEKK